MRRLCLFGVIAITALPGVTWAQAKVDDVTRTGEQRVDEGAAAQREIEKLGDQADDIAADYKQVTKVVDGLEIYNSLLQKQVDNQVAETMLLLLNLFHKLEDLRILLSLQGTPGSIDQ